MFNKKIIVAISGGKASAWCAGWALDNYPQESVILYFNDTKWEHPDLYRFLSDLEKNFNHEITFDSDGRNPEELFYDNNALANNFMPFCSRILKAERLQKYYMHDDILIFGIGINELDRAKRIVGVYQKVAAKTSKYPVIKFPLISNKITKNDIDTYLDKIGVSPPLLYDLGFKHNNCSGGCVRAGKKQWKLLLEKLPRVYANRERVEREMRKYTGKNITILKDETLEEFRKKIEKKELLTLTDDDAETECMGICETRA